jgi:hypothetical protein
VDGKGTEDRQAGECTYGYVFLVGDSFFTIAKLAKKMRATLNRD